VVIRSFVVCGAVLFLACTTVPEGLCENGSGCLPGLRCEEGVCVGCGGDGECQAWEACSEDRRCKLRAGMCATQAHCQAWEVCGTSNTCQLAEGSCQAATDCKSYENCDGVTRKCVLQAGRCSTSDNCAGGGLWGATCGEDNQCHSEPSGENDVLIWGTLSPGSCDSDAISSVLSPTRVQVGFGCNTTSSLEHAVLSPSGRIYYLDGEESPHRVKIFVPDGFKLEGRTRSYPPNGPANDTRVAAPKCGDTEDVRSFVMQAGTGAIAYTCGNTEVRSFYNSAGDVVASGYRMLAWSAEDFMLGEQNYSHDLVVRTPSRTLIPVTGLPFDWSFVDARAHPTTGFWLAGYRFNSGTGITARQLWHVANNGVATLQGEYGPVPENVGNVTYASALDSAGALYVESEHNVAGKGFVDVVVKRVADGSTGTIIYSEASAPESVNYRANFERVFNFMHISYLFAGP
jgi:hypothetical protein